MSSEEFKYAEILVDKLFLESFANEQSPYYSDEKLIYTRKNLNRIRTKLKWHIGHSLSKRQKQVIKHVLKGKTEREIAKVLGITQQVVHIYKHRAIRKLHHVLVT
jgi:DNA-binding CsgD family transcriptional regulator